jgi:hypothetical protein
MIGRTRTALLLQGQTWKEADDGNEIGLRSYVLSNRSAAHYRSRTGRLDQIEEGSTRARAARGLQHVKV